MRNALKWSALFLLCAAIAAVAVFAQTGGGLQGKVTDQSGQPVIGATIKVTGPALQGFQGAATDVNGEYRIPYLPVGKNYTVQVEAQGFNSVVRSGIDIPLGTTISLPFQLGQGTSTITVVGAAPIIDTKKDETGAVLSDTMINSIPLGRSSNSIVYLSPGVVDSGDRLGQGVGAAINGASGLENSYTVNGIEQVGSGNGTRPTGLNFDFIEATEVKTGGLDAEYGGLMGGQINSITKSGGNEFHGGLFAYYFDDGLEAGNRRLDNPSLAQFDATTKVYDLGGFLGGYLVKDKLWFFASFDYNKATNSTLNYQYTNPRMKINGAYQTSYANGRTLTDYDRNPQYAVKLTYNVNSNHRLSLSFFGNNERGSGDDWFLTGLTPTPSTWSSYTNSYSVSLQWNATWTPKFFTEAVIGTRRSWDNGGGWPTNPQALNSDNMRSWYGGGYFYPYDFSTGTAAIYSGNTALTNITGVITPQNGVGYLETSKDYNDQLRLKATNLFNVGKTRMELSYGIQYFNITYNRLSTYSGQPFQDTNPYDPLYGTWSQTGAIVRWVPSRYWGYPDPNADGNSHNDYLYVVLRGRYNNPQTNTSQKYYSYWVQDNWSLTDYFMLKVGLRLDQTHMKGDSLQGVNPNVIGTQSGTYWDGNPWTANVYGTPTFSTLPARTLNIDDSVAPRIGFTWDVAHNGKSKLYGFFGRYYERIPNDMAVRALSQELGAGTVYVDPQLTTTLDSVYGYPVSGYLLYGEGQYSTTTGIYPEQIVGGPNGGKLKGPYNDEYILGFQYEVAPDFTMGARAIYRDLGRTVEDISLDNAATYIVTNPDAWTNVWVHTSTGNWRFPRPTRRYAALEITADKRFSHSWQLGGSYVLSLLEGNYDGLFSPANQQVDANITSAFDLPDLLANGYGLLANDRTHVLKVYGGYSFDWGLDLSGNFQLQSGTPLNRMGSHPLYGANEAYLVPRGSEGRLPMTWRLDVAAQYNIKLFKTNLGLRVDVFNVTNEQKTTNIDQLYNSRNNNPGLKNNPYYGYETAHQAPRQVRLAVRWTF